MGEMTGDEADRRQPKRVRSRPSGARLVLCAALALFASGTPGEASLAHAQRFQRSEPPPQDRWYVVDRDEGVVVSAFERGEDRLPKLRATGTIRASLYEVAAVLWDADELDRWMAFTAESRLLQRKGELEFVFYQRMGAPWPVSDRDAVLSVRVRLDAAAGTLVSDFHETHDPQAPPRDGVVRMPRLRGRYVLQAIAPDRTRVQLLIDADPGGALPRWLVRTASRQLPLEMVLTLRARVAQVGDRYASLIAGWKSRHGEMVPRGR